MIPKLHRSLLPALVSLTLANASYEVSAGPKATRETAVAASIRNTSEAGMQLSGQELWSMNCQRCHNMRSPPMYSDAQWELIVHHMRVRANITGADQRAIADFLKSH